MMHKKLAAGVAIAALFAAGCGGDGDAGGDVTSPVGTSSAATGDTLATSAAGGELVVGRSSTIDGLQGDQCLGAGSIVVNPLVYDTLERIAPDGQGRVPGLASDVVYDPDALTYTYTIRDGAKFSDGSDLLADDVAFSIDQWRTGPISGAYFSMIASAEATDDHTVVVHLVQPDTFMPDLFVWCMATVYPKDFGGLTADEYFEKPVSGGPYAVESWSNPGPSETLRLVRNPYYWNADEVLLDAIEFRSSSDAGQRSLAFESGEIDVLENIDSIAARTLPEGTVMSVDAMPIQYLLVNSTLPELADSRVRQAISRAIDRDEIVAALDGFGVPAAGVLPINVPNSVIGDEPLRTDLAEAAALMEEVGVSDLSLDLIYDNTGGDDSAVAGVVAEQLGKVGITVNLVPSDSGTIFGRLSSGDFQLAMSGAAAVSPNVMDPVSFLYFAYYPWTGADTTMIGEQFAIGTSTVDPAEIQAAVVAIQNDAWDQSTAIGLYNLEPTFGVSPNVKGFNPLPYLVWYGDGISFQG